MKTEKSKVIHPRHYVSGGLECIDAMLATQGAEAVKSFCICNAFKYLWRHNSKEGAQSIEKAVWYLLKYLELQEVNGDGRTADVCEVDHR